MATQRIAVRRDTHANFAAVDVIPVAGEPTYEIDTKLFRVSDGVSSNDELDAAAFVDGSTKQFSDDVRARIAANLADPSTPEGGALAGASTGSPRQPAGAVKAVFLGDSITHGSNASAGRRWVDQLPRILGTATLSSRSVEAGVPGQTSAEMLARYDSAVRANGAQALFLLAGTNDANQGVPLESFASNVRGIAEQARRDGIPIIVGTVPPMGTSAVTSAKALLIAQYNAWLHVWAPQNGIRLAAVNSALVAAGSENMLGGYDSGDGIHPETNGHQRIAEAFAAAFAPLASPGHLVKTVSAFNLIGNPLFLTDYSGGWFNAGGSVGTAPTIAVAPDTSGTLHAGNWGTISLDATAATSGYYRAHSISSGFSPGDKLLVTGRGRVVDKAGGYKAAASGANPTADFSVRLANPNLTTITNLNGPSATTTPGPFAQVVTVPTGATALYIVVRALLPQGQSADFQVGELGVFNVTALPDLANLV